MSENKNTPKRPFGLYIIIGMQLTIAIALALGLLTLELVDLYPGVLVVNPLYFTSFGWVMVGTLILAVIGLLRFKRWGWTLTMIVTGAGLAYNIWQYFTGEPNYINMAINIVIVFYLYQRDVQAPFLSQSTPGEAG